MTLRSSIYRLALGIASATALVACAGSDAPTSGAPRPPAVPAAQVEAGQAAALPAANAAGAAVSAPGSIASVQTIAGKAAARPVTGTAITRGPLAPVTPVAPGAVVNCGPAGSGCPPG